MDCKTASLSDFCHRGWQNKRSGQDTGTGVRKLKLETHFCFYQFMTAPFNFLSLHFPFWKTGSWISTLPISSESVEIMHKNCQAFGVCPKLTDACLDSALNCSLQLDSIINRMRCETRLISGYRISLPTWTRHPWWTISLAMSLA